MKKSKKPSCKGYFLGEEEKKMIQTQTEKFTAREAVNAGLIEAIKRGETKLECHVAVEKGDLNFSAC